MPTFIQHISYFLTDNFGTIQEIISDVFIFTLINGRLFAERLGMASSVVQRKDFEIAAGLVLKKSVTTQSNVNVWKRLT